MGIRIKYYVDAEGKDRFRISGMNGEPMAGGEAYESAEGAAHAVQVIANAFQSGDVVIEDGGDALTEQLFEDEESGDEQHVEVEGGPGPDWTP